MTSSTPNVSGVAGILRMGDTFCDAMVLMTAVELDLFSALHHSPATEEEIRRRLRLHGRGLSDFLRLLVAFGLLEKDGDHYRNAANADLYLVREQQTCIGGFLMRSRRNRYPVWGKLGEALRTGQKQSGGEFTALTENPMLLGQFIGMMDALTQQLGPELVEAFDFSDYASVLDVGGCRGNMAGHIVKAHPHLEGHVLDLPPMEPFFNEHMENMGLTGKVRFHAGSFFERELPRSDLVILGHVLHDWDAEQRDYLVRKAFDALLPGGALLVYDRMLDDEPHHLQNLIVSLDMLLVTDGGSEYPASELQRHAAAAGFATSSQQPLGDYDTLVVCRKG
jgi:SAM-dependent methyltransferase